MAKYDNIEKWGSLAHRVYDAILTLLQPLLDKFNNYVSLTVYQGDDDDKLIETTGINTYVNNKVDVPLTIEASVGGLDLDLINKWIINNSLVSKRLSFDAVASVSDPGDNNTLIHFALFKNGITLLPQSVSKAKLESLTGAATLNAATSITLDPGEYVEVYCTTDKINGSFTASHIQLRFLECPRLTCPM